MGRTLIIIGAIATALGVSTVAAAHSGGQPSAGCVGCHGGGDVELGLSASSGSIEPGEMVTVTLTVASAGQSVAGVFISADTGELEALGGGGLAEVNSGLTHTSPRSMAGGSAEFQFRWTAPNDPGAVRFSVSVLAANGNGGSSGDRGDDGDFDLVYGCTAQEYWYDGDGDGFGRDDAPLTHCVGGAPQQYATAGADCDDSRESVYPGAVELCNLRDDDCDEEIDEDAIPIELFPDGDGDGYYGQLESESLDIVVGCVGTPDYAGEPGDCEPDNPEMHPDAEEVCNLYDDNCDGRVDERVRPICGIGWCAREAWTCEADTCQPGEPTPETCNLLDDDCDELVDEDAPCDEGMSCYVGECRPDGEIPDTTGEGGEGGEGGSMGDSGGGTTGGGTGAQQ
ncbi:MAG: hypothetical protein IAG13_17275, partial [Deltaproteobacteria bacterium]|nr:hypothetical protein [Nannocystaceae bacterium]